ncbi:MAG: IscS subfamily cysteine desulfurase [Rhodospirillaceae bacterium]|nr:IscS subfamily cysteine desulfurase [Rhodospirillaceae bacterium]
MDQSKKPIYLDCHATTPVDPRVAEAMMPYFTEKFGNPHSSGHFYGWEVAEAIEIAREQVAALINAEPEEIFCTSGATEANNTAIKGVARFYREHRNHLVTAVSEHMCVLDSCFQLEREGFDVTYLQVGSDGLLDLEELKAALTDQTILVSIMSVQNEIGTIQPMAKIGAICRERKVFLHTDAAQAVGKIPIDVKQMKIDLLSLTAHKIFGPMGIGALYVGKKPRVRLEPIFSGGGQEKGLRSGTLAPALCVGLGEALRIADEEMLEDAARLGALRDQMWQRLYGAVPGLVLNGSMTNRIGVNLNFSVDGADAESLMAALPGLAVSSGSACSSASDDSSHVLKAIGLSNALAEASLRIGLGRFTTADEVESATKQLVKAITKVRDGRYEIAAAE